MKLIGIDPGSFVTGYGILEIEKDVPTLIEKGIIKVSHKTDKYKRVELIYQKVSEILAQNQPDCAAIEDSFYHKNVKTALYLGQIKGIIILALQKNNCKIYEFSPLEIKRAVVGYGQATKDQVEVMVKRLLNMNTETLSYDCSDAIAAALCLSASIKLLRIGVV
jgi:crossover junction endodeoxyribonuclease RuvC